MRHQFVTLPPEKLDGFNPDAAYEAAVAEAGSEDALRQTYERAVYLGFDAEALRRWSMIEAVAARAGGGNATMLSTFGMMLVD